MACCDVFAQVEIKSTVTVNTSDIAAKAQEDTTTLTPAGIEKLALNGRNGGGVGGFNKKHANGNLVVSDDMKEELEEVSLVTLHLAEQFLN